MAINDLSSRAVFLDKDGTLVENVPYNVDPKQIRLVPGAIEGLKLLHAAGYKLIVVSNQSGVARGLFKESALAQVEEHLMSVLKEAGIPLSGFYYCPHHPDGRVRDYTINCMCRKPRPGMLFTAAREHQINLASSWIIGDILDDIEAGRRADCSTILIDNGNETEWSLTPYRRPHHTAHTLLEAARMIDKSSRPKQMDNYSNLTTQAGASL
jgi:D-glycero-D-manno-heptose 1,7-bisphosphate phosphatase